MAMVARPTPPTLGDAAAAASACAAVDRSVVRVLAFGSVARGLAGEGSDIDLVVLVSDDAAARSGDLAGRLAAAGRAATGLPCDVTLRTKTAWDHLTENVSASFEARISQHALVLYESHDQRTPGRTCSLDGVPRDNMDVSANYAEGAALQLDTIARLIRGAPDDSQPGAGEDPALEEQTRIGATQVLLSKAHLALEQSIRSIGSSVHDLGFDKDPRLDDMVSQMEGDIRRDLDAVLDPLRRSNGLVRNWRSGPYALAVPDWVQETTAENAQAHIDAALAAARLAARELAAHPSATGLPAEAASLLAAGISALEQLQNRPQGLESPADKGPDIGL